MSTQTFEISVNGLARPVTVTAEFEAPDYSTGISGGWFLVEAELVAKRMIRLDREEFECLFGSEALRVAEENIADLAQARIEDEDRHEVGIEY